MAEFKGFKQRKYIKILRTIKGLAPKYQSMTDEELRAQTEKFRQRLQKGETLAQILPEAYATAIEADRRILGMAPYDVQVLGAIVLFHGNVAEMKTGEGKTLTATMALYLMGLTGPGNFLVTANEYLAWRDAEEVGKVYRWLGLSVAVGVQRNAYDKEVDRSVVYKSDIVYTTHSGLGFDYLLDNLATEVEKQYLQGFNFVVIDELDAILLDMAQIPLIISGAPTLQFNLYHLADKFVKSLTEEVDYEISEDKQQVWFTEEGIAHASRYFGLPEILSEENQVHYRHLVLALKANYVQEVGRHYVVEEDEIFLLDEMNGRKMVGTKLQGGMHQAIEAKEEVTITLETKSMGSITYQNLFKMFRVLSGMTGTAYTDVVEIRDTYDIDVVPIPTHRPIKRKDHKSIIYLSNKAKMLSSLELVKKAVAAERPVLIATGSVTKSRLYSLILLNNRIPHSLLNATTATAAKEKRIVHQAGQRGAVTVATAMAGRGTDIKLDDFSRGNGGLMVVGTESMTSDRIDNQLRGRAGRQGEPGDSYFYTSLEDKVVVESSPEWVRKFRKNLENKPDDEVATQEGLLNKKKFQRLIEKSQKNKKNQDVNSRKTTLEFDDVISVLRERVYATRNKVLIGTPTYFREVILKSYKHTTENFVAESKNRNVFEFSDFILNNLDYGFDQSRLDGFDKMSVKALRKLLDDIITEKDQQLLENFPHIDQGYMYQRFIILKSLDQLWIDLADALVQLKTVVQSRTFGQQRPLHEFEKEANRYFTECMERLWIDITRNMLLSELFINRDGSVDIELP
ncbi:preprotein translocase subunit SecA [Lactococcus garvieae]|nr:preprotein translocase subunit SecA [Lactococcus garvieae]